jgi:16S rRNA (uracil1498-N3)-methyltransferase
MNRILFEPSEIGSEGVVRAVGRRAVHLASVLHATAGCQVRVGILDGPAGVATVEGAGEGEVVLRCRFDPAPPPRPFVGLLLALPRPKVLKRLWAPLASIGVDRIVLTNAAKVERCYFDTHWLDPGHYRPLLVEGLEQSGDTRVPEVMVRRRFKPLVEDELDGRFPNGLRLVGHPGGPRVEPARLLGAKAPRILVAVGPEGGWTDWELDLLAAHGFEAVSLGWRTLRTDTACIALLALAHAALTGGTSAAGWPSAT